MKKRNSRCETIPEEPLERAKSPEFRIVLKPTKLIKPKINRALNRIIPKKKKKSTRSVSLPEITRPKQEMRYIK